MTHANITAFVGAGGKTTIMNEMAAKAAAAGKKVVVATTTHILMPDAGYALNMQEVRALWDMGRYAVVGRQEEGSGKLVAVSASAWKALTEAADYVFVEADGAKGMPCKAPADHEPVLPTPCHKVIAVAGVDAVGQSGYEACFRWELARKELGVSDNHILQPYDIARLLVSPRGQKKNAQKSDFVIILNKCDTEEDLNNACAIHRILVSAGFDVKKIGFRGGMLHER